MLDPNRSCGLFDLASDASNTNTVAPSETDVIIASVGQHPSVFQNEVNDRRGRSLLEQLSCYGLDRRSRVCAPAVHAPA